MLRNLLNTTSQIGSKSTSQWSGISSFICQRANLTSEEVSKVNSQFESLSKKYKISKHELTNAIQIASINVEYLEKILPRQQFFHQKEEVVQRYAQSTFYSLGKTPQETRRVLLKRFPELSSAASYGYGEAINDLRKLFVIEGQSNNLSGSRFVTEFQANVDSYISNLRQIHEQNGELKGKINQLESTLQQILKNVQANPSYYARILTRTEGAITTSTPTNVASENVPQKNPIQTNDPDAEDRRLLSAQLTNQIQVSHGQYLEAFSQDRKMVFQATVRHFHTIRWQILAGALGVMTLYFLWQGDAKYKTLLLVPVGALVCGVIARRNSVKNSFAYVKEIALHKDGQKVDIIVQLNKSFQKFENVPVTSLKLFISDVDLPTRTDKEWFNTSELRKDCSISGNILKFEEKLAFVPHDYTGNQVILNQLFKGHQISAEFL